MSDAVLNQFTQQTAEEKKTGRMKRIGIIGTGGIAHAHIKRYLMMDDVQIVAMADMPDAEMSRIFSWKER